MVRAEPRPGRARQDPGPGRDGWVVWAGLLALALAIGAYAVNMALHPLHILLSDVDLAVYRDAGLVARRSPGQLYQWQQPSGLRFTYTPFAAAFCVVMSLLFPRASATWWLGGAFEGAGRTGFVGYLANQSLLGMITRLAGAVPPAWVWLVLAVLVGGPGLALAARVHRRGQPVHGWVVCAVTGLIISPVSWDHHWVWIAPALAVLTDTTVRARPPLRAAWWAAGGLTITVFGAWPSVWPGGGAAVPWGLIWYAPATPADVGTVHPEYHWTGLQLLAGNLYLLAGFAGLAAAAVAAARHPPPRLRKAATVTTA